METHVTDFSEEAKLQEVGLIDGNIADGNSFNPFELWLTDGKHGGALAMLAAYQKGSDKNDL